MGNDEKEAFEAHVNDARMTCPYWKHSCSVIEHSRDRVQVTLNGSLRTNQSQSRILSEIRLRGGGVNMNLSEILGSFKRD